MSCNLSAELNMIRMNGSCKLHRKFICENHFDGRGVDGTVIYFNTLGRQVVWEGVNWTCLAWDRGRSVVGSCEPSNSSLLMPVIC